MSQYAHTGQSPHDRPQRNYVVALILSFFLGGVGVDRFYLGHIGLGITKLLLNGFITIITFGLGGWIWWLIDFIMIATRNVKNDTFVWDDEVQQPHQQAPYQYPGNPGTGFQTSPGQESPQPHAPGQYAQPTSFTPYSGPGAAPSQHPSAPSSDTAATTDSWQQWEEPTDQDIPASTPADNTPVPPVSPDATPHSMSTPPPAPSSGDSDLTLDHDTVGSDTVEPVTTESESTEQESDAPASPERNGLPNDQQTFPWKQ